MLLTLEKIRATRLDPTTIRISWQHNGGSEKVSVFWADSPHSSIQPAGRLDVAGQSSVDIPGLDPNTRYYFTLKARGVTLGRTAERLVPLEGTFNFRDLGGYKTIDGRRIKWGRIFRSDNLAGLTAKDHTLLKRMGLKLVCDFRSQAEVSHSPDSLPGSGKIGYLHLPMVLGTLDAVEAVNRIKHNDLEWLTPSYMPEGYIKNLEQSAEKWAAVITRLSEDQFPLVFHCSAGKDRTGICAGLILLALGVPEETVIFDHGLSNHYLEAFLPKVFSYFESLGLDTDRLTPYLSAPREAMLAALEHIKGRYGSVSAYLEQKAGISPKEISKLQHRLLEDCHV